MKYQRDMPQATRRGFLTGAAGLAAAGSSLAPGAALALDAGQGAEGEAAKGVVPFRGAHQAGIVTSPQAHTYFAAFDLTTDKRAAVETLLRAWTDAAALLCASKPVDIPGAGDQAAEPDPADVRGLSAARLTLTFGFGAGLFVKDGRDRYGLRAHRP